MTNPVTDPNLLAQLNAPQLKPQVKDASVLAQLEYGIDFSQPENVVRQDIAKLLPTDQQAAQNLWAEHRVKKTYGPDNAPAPELAKGIPIIGPALDEIAAGVSGVTHTLSGGQLARPYDEALAYERAKERAAANAHPVWNAAGKLGAGIVGGAPLARAVTPAQTFLGRVGQGITVGAPVGAAEGFLGGEGGAEKRVGSAVEGGIVGTALGVGLPIAASLATRGVGIVRDSVMPTVTRWREGVEAAADDILARKLAAEEATAGQKRLDLQRGQAWSSKLGPNSEAELPEMIADTSDSFRRLLGSLYRTGGDAGNQIKRALDVRQRGVDNKLGRVDPDAPMGQADRLLDATQRALLVRGADTARQTERQILRAQKLEGDQLYGQARANSEDFDLQPALDAMSLQILQYPRPFQRQLRAALNLFLDDTPNRMPVNDIARFDASKKVLDDLIETASRKGNGNLNRLLTEFKNNLLNAVHGVDDAGKATKNLIYQQARESWGTAAENREAIDLGRRALQEGSEVSAEQFRELTRGQQVLFRIGFLDSLKRAIATSKPGDDITRLFQQRRVQELMNDIIPFSRGNGTFADRRERFGDLLGREQRMVQTRNEVLGNSKTQQRGQDDLQFSGDALANMWDRFRQSPSLFAVGVEAVGTTIRKVFGYRQDVAQALARRLLETDPTTRNQILRRLAARGGANTFARFAEGLDRASNVTIGAMAQPLRLNDDSKR